jgi:hypothetical protein
MTIQRSVSLAVAVLGVAVAATVDAAGPAEGINVTIVNPPTQPLPVTGTLPANAFTIPPQTIFPIPVGEDVAPDPAGTRYAITSVTVSNPSDSSGEVALLASASNSAISSCRLFFGGVDFADGPRLYVQARTTTHLAFPQPYVTGPLVAGSQVCLLLSGPGVNSNGSTWSAVGYKIFAQ